MDTSTCTLEESGFCMKPETPSAERPALQVPPARVFLERTVEGWSLLCDSVGDVGGDGNAKHLVLGRLNHQHNPKHATREPNHGIQAETHQEEMHEPQHN